eukprot:COSAG02_NODE_14493_length_1266_cov_1.679520_2_plen_23_part_01
MSSWFARCCFELLIVLRNLLLTS